MSEKEAWLAAKEANCAGTECGSGAGGVDSTSQVNLSRVLAVGIRSAEEAWHRALGS